MEGSEWAAMAAASMQALGQMGNAYMAAKASDDDRAFAAKMYDRQREDALSDWNMMNEYNDPSNVMARLARAGLNPNLAISKGVDASAAAPVRASSANNMVSGRTPQFNMDFMAAANLMSQIKLNESQANKNNAEANRANAETEGQNIQNEINNATKQIQIDIADGNRYKIMAEGHQIDQNIVNGNLMLQKNLTLTDEQISTLIQTRFVQWSELELKKYQIGENIKQAWRNLEIEAKNANTSATNAAANMIMAVSNKARNDKLNELSVFQLGDAAIEFQKKYSEMERLKQQAQLSHENEIKYQEALKRFEENVGIPYEIIHDLIPLAPNMSRTSYDPKSGTTTTWKF